MDRMKRRFVVKIGTRLLTDARGLLSSLRVRHFVRQVSDLIERHSEEVIVVSSGAIAAGRGCIVSSASTMREKQALAAVGQTELMVLYRKYFSQRGYKIGQVLLTREDLARRSRYINIHHTIESLLRHKVIPVLNENDAVAVEEIQFGDNDLLSALVASKMEADALVILTDVDGFCMKKAGGAEVLVREVHTITPDMVSAARRPRLMFSRGGMASKIDVARIMMSSGIPFFIANGNRKDTLIRIASGENPGTRFIPRKEKMASRKSWIAFSAPVEGYICVDKGARDALVCRRMSLLPSGVTGVEGVFAKGSVVMVKDGCGRAFARGIVSFSAEEVRSIMGKKTADITAVLGKRCVTEVIHRDNLVITE